MIVVEVIGMPSDYSRRMFCNIEEKGTKLKLWGIPSF